MDRLLVVALLFICSTSAANAATQRTITIDHIGGETWQCTPGATIDSSSGATRFTGLTASENHRLTAEGNHPPIAAFDLIKDQRNVSVDAGSSSDEDGDAITSYAWDWGDGSSQPASADATGNHEYAANGVYTVTLTVTDEHGAAGTTSRQVAVSDGTGNTPPVADPKTVRTPEDTTVTFFLTGSDVDGDDLTFDLDIPFGTPGSFSPIRKGDRLEVRYQPDFPQPHFFGEVVFTFTVSDGTATSDPATVRVIVEPVNDAPHPDFSVNLLEEALGVQVDASATSDVEGDEFTDFTWDWGDGSSPTSGTSPTATHVYAEAGSYLVTLTVTDAQGGVGTLRRQVVPPSGGTDTPGHGGLSMRALDGGSFVMGENDVGEYYDFGNEGPEHTVTISPFAISTYEVTNAQYVALMNWAIDEGLVTASAKKVEYEGRILLDLDMAEDRDNQIRWDGNTLIADGEGWVRTGDDVNNHPTSQVTWYGAMVFCAFLNQREGLEQAIDLDEWTIDFTADGYRLPTEAEWEYAARGGLTQKVFPWGDELDGTLANYWNSAAPYQHRLKSPVGFYLPNGFGLYDMAGNEMEWCADWYDAEYYSDSPEHDPLGPASGTYRVLRDGGFSSGEGVMRCSARRGGGTEVGQGFRPARSTTPGTNQ